MTLFLTERLEADGTYGDSIEAVDWGSAQTACDRRDRGETVIGRHVLSITGNFTDEEIDRMCRAFAEQDAFNAEDDDR